MEHQPTVKHKTLLGSMYHSMAGIGKMLNCVTDTATATDIVKVFLEIAIVVVVVVVFIASILVADSLNIVTIQ